MLAEKNDKLHEASEALYVMNAEQMIRERCQAREDFYRIQLGMQREVDKATAKYNAAVAEKEALASENKTLVAEKEALTSEKEALASEKEALVLEKEALASKTESLAVKLAEYEKLLLENGISVDE